MALNLSCRTPAATSDHVCSSFIQKQTGDQCWRVICCCWRRTDVSLATSLPKITTAQIKGWCVDSFGCPAAFLKLSVDARRCRPLPRSADETRRLQSGELGCLWQSGLLVDSHLGLTDWLTDRVSLNQVMSNPDRLSRMVERVVEDFCWIQWDGHAQRIYYLTCAALHAQASTWRGGLDSRSDRARDRNVSRRTSSCCGAFSFTPTITGKLWWVNALSEFDFYFCRRLIKTRFYDLQLELPLDMPANPFRTVK